MLSRSVMRPDFQSPAGTMTWPPPRLASWSMARWMLPLVLRMLSVRSGKAGRCSCGMPSKVAPMGAMSAGQTFAPTSLAVGISSVTCAEAICANRRRGRRRRFMERKRFRDGEGRRGRSNRSDWNNLRTPNSQRTQTALRNSEFSEKELLRILDIFEKEAGGGDTVAG